MLDTGFHEILRNTHEINNDSDASAESKKVRDVEEGVWRGGAGLLDKVFFFLAAKSKN